MRKFIVEYEDAAAGMVRYDTMRFEAGTPKEAEEKFYKKTKKWGPGLCVVNVKEDTVMGRDILERLTDTMNVRSTNELRRDATIEIGRLREAIRIYDKHSNVGVARTIEEAGLTEVVEKALGK